MTENATQFRAEGEPAFPVENKENDNSSSSSEGKETNTEHTQSQGGENSNAEGDGNGADDKGGDAGFANHPRWKEREADWTRKFNEQETRHQDDLRNIREEFETKYGGKKPDNAANGDGTPVQIPSWFGGNEQQWKEFTEWNKTLLSGVSESAVKAIDERTTKEQARIDEATKFFEKEVGAIETDKTLNPKGEKVDRNKLLKFVMDNDLVTSDGRWNYRAGYRMMQVMGSSAGANSSSTAEKKNVAGASVADRRSDAPPASVTTSDDFKKPGARPW